MFLLFLGQLLLGGEREEEEEENQERIAVSQCKSWLYLFVDVIYFLLLVVLFFTSDLRQGMLQK
jgi:hypothetical protein